MRKMLLALALAAGLTAHASAATYTIDFESLALGPVPGNSLSVTTGGVTVTFSALTLSFVQFGLPFDAVYGIRNLNPGAFQAPLTVTFSAPVGAVEIINPINGSLTSEVDVISGIAYDAGTTVLDSFSTGIERPRLEAPGIRRAVFDDVNTAYAIAALSFEVPDPVSIPAPAPAGLLALGVGLLALVRRSV